MMMISRVLSASALNNMAIAAAVVTLWSRVNENSCRLTLVSFSRPTDSQQKVNDNDSKTRDR